MTRPTRRQFLITAGLAGMGLVSLDEREGVTASLPPRAPARVDYSQVAKLSADDGDAGDHFGSSVAISGDGTTSIIGTQDISSAYVFEQGDEEWTQQAELDPQDVDRNDGFGASVAISNDGGTVIVGASLGDDENVPESGSAYVFERGDEEWTQQAELIAQDSETESRFGSSVAMTNDGRTAIVGARLDDDPNGPDAGSAYVFERGDEEWTQQAKLAADDGDRSDEFGSSVAISSDGATALVGARFDEDPNGNNSGSAYVFQRTDDEWAQETKLATDDGAAGDVYGSSVALSSEGDTALVGARSNESPDRLDAGSAYVFERGEEEWTQQTKLAADDGDPDGRFGTSVALPDNGSTALVGVPRDDEPNGKTAGSAYVFERGDGEWTQQAKLAADDGDRSDEFGSSVAISSDGTTALSSARSDDDPNGKGSGSAYVFRDMDREQLTETPTSTPAPTQTPTPAPTQTPTPAPTQTPTPAPTQTPTPAPAGTPAEATTPSRTRTPTSSVTAGGQEQTEGESGPGLGIGSALLSVAGAVYLLNHAISENE